MVSVTDVSDDTPGIRRDKSPTVSYSRRPLNTMLRAGMALVAYLGLKQKKSPPLVANETAKANCMKSDTL